MLKIKSGMIKVQDVIQWKWSVLLFWLPLSGTYIGTPFHGTAHVSFKMLANSCEKLQGEGKHASVAKRRFAVRACADNVSILGAPSSSVWHGCIWCSVKSRRRNVMFNIMQKLLHRWNTDNTCYLLKQVWIQTLCDHFIPYRHDRNSLKWTGIIMKCQVCQI